jgi:hypothetical protein
MPRRRYWPSPVPSTFEHAQFHINTLTAFRPSCCIRNATIQNCWNCLYVSRNVVFALQTSGGHSITFAAVACPQRFDPREHPRAPGWRLSGYVKMGAVAARIISHQGEEVSKVPQLHADQRCRDPTQPRGRLLWKTIPEIRVQLARFANFRRPRRFLLTALPLGPCPLGPLS